MALNEKQTTELKKLANSSPLAKAALELLAVRERPRLNTDLRRLRQQIGHERPDVVITTPEFFSIFKQLERMGLGKLVHPKAPTEPARFNWKSVELSALAPQTATGLKPEPKVSVSALGNGHLKVSYPHGYTSFPLRGSLVQFPVPTDGLSKDEFNTVVDILKAYVRR